jgi:glycosyltransferase involved in cell wall biosynthesis
MIGISLNGAGGMTSVVRTYQSCGFFDEWDVSYLSSYERPGLGSQLRVMSRALATFLHMLIGREVALVHVHSASRGSFWRKSIFCAVARAFRIPYIFHVHSGEFPTFVRSECGPLARCWVRHTLRNACSVITLTSSWHAEFAELVPGATIAVLGNPVLMPERIAALRKNVGHVLFLGRLHEKKGVFDLVRAIPSVLEQVPEAKFTLAGDGDLRGVAQQAEMLGVSHVLNLVGWVDGAVKEALLASADLLVLPSHYEGFSVSLVEAMAAGVPVVSTAVGGVPDVLEDGACGVLVAPRDVKALADALINTLLDTQANERMRERAFVRAKERFSIPKILGALGNIYHAAKLDKG